jgi:hypothetical protein
MGAQLSGERIVAAGNPSVVERPEGRRVEPLAEPAEAIDVV